MTETHIPAATALPYLGLKDLKDLDCRVVPVEDEGRRWFPIWETKPESVADHAEALSNLEPEPKAAKHDLAEFASLITGFDLTDHQKRTVEMMKVWLDNRECGMPIMKWPSRPRYHHPIFTDLADAEARTLAAMAAVPRTIHSMIYPVARKKPETLVMDIESYGFEDRWKVGDYHFASGPGLGKTWTMQFDDPYFPAPTGRPVKLLDAAVTAIDRALERAPKIEVPADFTAPTRPTSNRAERRRAGRKPRG